MKALLLVDIQNDFLEGGALAVDYGQEIIPLIEQIIHYPFHVKIATKDWHPFNHGSFAANHGKNPGDHMKIAGLDQILWPVHCVQGTKGAEFAKDWDTTQLDKIIYKGTDPLIDSYSTFFNNGHQRSTGLEYYLREKGIKEIFIAGLATDYCVKYSVLDALQLGFQTYVIMDACRGVNLIPGDVKRAFDIMKKAGAILLNFKDLLPVLQKNFHSVL